MESEDHPMAEHRINTRTRVKELIRELDKTKSRLKTFNKRYPSTQILTVGLAQNLLNLNDKIANLVEKIMGEI